MTEDTNKTNIASVARAQPLDGVTRILADGGRLGTSLLAGGALFLVHGYRLLLSPVLPGTCRFGPSCSEYAAEAITRHGPFRGGWLAFARVARCHPWGGDGYDPVPAAERRSDQGNDARRA